MKDTTFFSGKRVTVMGLGLLGRGVGDAAYIAGAGAAEVIVTDLKDEAALAESVGQLRDFPNVRFVLGEHRVEDFQNVDLVVVAAGAPTHSPYLAAAREAGVRLCQSAALFAELSGVPIIGVTGTRGKSTVTHMIHHVLTTLTGETVLLGGNVRGVSNLQLLHEVRDDSLCVMELDSWQLQGFGWAGISPQVAVFTNFMEDHLNYYQAGGRSHDEAMAAYFADKANIFRFQTESGVLITTPVVFAQAQDFARSAGITLGQEVVLADVSVLPEDMLLSVPGAHNRQNAALAYEALKALDLPDEEIFEALTTFPGVPGRLEYVGATETGARVYNDNNATTPTATMAGIEAVAGEQNVVLIAGGAYKEVDPAPLLPLIEQHVKRLILLPGTGTDRLVSLLETEGQDNWTVVLNLKEAVAQAVAQAEVGDVILFSPGFASFGLFKNEYDRNDVFMREMLPLLE
jgi:UDP-N-acetylmuramoylalanine--D-glutamate ligase